MSLRSKCLVLGIAGAVLAAPAGACGPFFPNQLLFNASQSVAWAPVGSFDREIRRILPQARAHAVMPEEKQSVYDQTLQVDLAELRAALAESKSATTPAEKTLERYRAVRQAISDYQHASNDADEKPESRPALPAGLEVPEGLPTEFALYLRGMLRYQAGQMEEARAAWTSLLGLPADQRTRRTVWAQFMIGKSYLGRDAGKAITAFRAVRRLVDSGRPDSLGLAAASLGWEARAEYQQHHLAEAISLYLQQCATGDASAVQSLAIVCGNVFEHAGAESLKQLASDPSASRALMAYAVSRGVFFRAGPSDPMLRRWLAAVESVHGERFVGAERLAWSAYQAGDMAAAGRWAARAPQDAPIVLWVRAKLLLRAGKLDAAAGLLARAARGFPTDETWDQVPGSYFNEAFSPGRRAQAELGVLELSRGNYVDALDRLLRSGWWIDAAYVAERVLTANELVAYVDRNWPDGSNAPIRHLLARRLTRIGRWKEARAYFPKELVPRLDEYIADIRAGHDSRLSAHERALKLWAAARIARRDGMELLGTELAPDDHLYGGSFPGMDVAEDRRKDKGRLVRPTPDEIQRARQSAPAPVRRFHYRFIAADHAWAAAQLLPDESDELASLLCEAGSWIKDLDVKAADRFYKTLVTRCGQTRLGRAAAARKWFPDGSPN